MNEAYRLDRCCVYADERALRCGDDIVPLPPKALDVLVALLERRGGVVSNPRRGCRLVDGSGR